MKRWRDIYLDFMREGIPKTVVGWMMFLILWMALGYVAYVLDQGR